MTFREIFYYNKQQQELIIWDDPEEFGNYTIFYVRFNWSKNFQMPVGEVAFYMN